MSSDPLALLSQVPQCVLPNIFKGLAESKCGVDVACVCTSDAFLSLLQGTVQQTCNKAETQQVLDFARELCVSAIPGLNDTRVPLVLAVLIVVTTLSTCAVGLRLIARRLSKARFLWDDYLIILALILTLGLDINVFVGVREGFGKHILTLSLNQLIGFAKSNFATQILFGSAITTTKLSILCFYHRILPFRTFITLSITTGCVMVAWWISLVFTVIFSCHPVSFFWDKSISGGTCMNENAISYGFSGANVATDLIVLCLPIPWLWKLQLPLARKLNVIGIFLLGGLVCVAGIVRIPLLVQLVQTDVTWTIVNAGIWINIETNIGIVCACLPTLRPLLLRLSPMLTKLTASRSSKNSNKQTPQSHYRDHKPRISEPYRDNSSPDHGYARDDWSSTTNTKSSKEGGRTGGGRFLLTNKSGRSQSRSWYGDVMASFARVDREDMRREEWIRLRNQRNMV